MRKKLTLLMSLLIVVSFISTSMTISFADNIVDTEITDTEELDNEEIDEEEKNAQLEDVSFDMDVLENMVDIFLGIDTTYDENSDRYFKAYTDVYNNSGKVLHTPLITGGKVALYDKNFAQTRTEGVVDFITLPKYMNKSYTSPYIKDKFVWTKFDLIQSDALIFSNFYAAAVRKAGDDIGETTGIGVDNYGNIVTNNMQVIVPFYLNRSIIESAYKDNKKDSMSDIDDGYSIIGTKMSSSEIKELSELVAGELFTGDKLKMYSVNGGSIVFPEEYWEEELITTENIALAISEGAYDRSKIKEFILSNFSEAVEEHNEYFIEQAEELQDDKSAIKVYSGITNYGSGALIGDAKQEQQELLDDLIRTILTGGAGRLLQLTLAFTVSDMYQEVFIDFSAKYIYHTSYYEDSVVFQNLVGAYFALMVAFLMLYLVISVFSIVRGRITIGGLIKRLALLIVVMTLPIVIYPKVINKIYNEPTSAIAKNEINKIMLLDRWALLAEKNHEEKQKEALFSLDRVFRGSQYNYLIKFNTGQFTDETNANNKLKKHISTAKSLEEYEEIKANLDDRRVQVLVDANHFIDFLNEGGDTNLFEYLYNNLEEHYKGLGYNSENYTEYSYYIPSKSIVSTETNMLTASELALKVFDYYKENDIEISERLSDLVSLLSDTKYNISNAEIEEIIGVMSGVPQFNTRYTSYYEEMTIDDFETEIEYEKYKIIQGILSDIGGGDITGSYNMLKEVSKITDDEDPNIYELVELTKEINTKIIQDYMENTYPTSRVVYNVSNSSDMQSYEDAENDIIKLNIFFIISDKLVSSSLLPTSIEISKVESDVYIRSLVIPVTDIKPDNNALENAAIFIGTKTSLGTLALFFIFIVILIAYGLLKLIIISTILLPLLMGMMLWTYIIKEQYESKLWYGALRIIVVFAAMHAGFMGVWKFVIVRMNSAIMSSMTLGGRASFFNPVTNMCAIILYFVLVTMFVLIPMFKVIKANVGDLGGAEFMAKDGEMVMKIAKGISEVEMFGNKSKGKNSGESVGSMDMKGSNTKETIKQKELKEEKLANDMDKNHNEEELASETKAFDEDIFSNKKGFIKTEVGKDNSTLKFTTDRPLEALVKSKEGEEKAKSLKEGGYFVAKAQQSDVDGSASNEMKLPNSTLANSVSKFMKLNGINGSIDGDKLSLEGTTEEIISKKGGLENYLSMAKTAIAGTSLVGGTTVASTVSKLAGGTIGFSEDNKNIVDGLVKSGDLSGAEVVGVGEDMKIKFSPGKDRQDETVLSKLNGSLTEKDREGIEFKSEISSDYNSATEQAVQMMKSKGKIKDFVVEGDDDNKKIKITTQYGEANSVMEELEKVSGDLNKALDLGVTEKNTSKLSVNDMTENIIQSSESITQGVDYEVRDGHYVSLTEKGNEVITRLYNEDVVPNKKEIIRSYENPGEININESNRFKDSEMNTGRKHDVTSLGYEPEEIISTISKLKNSAKTIQELELLERINRLNNIRDIDGRLVIYTDNSVEHTEVSKIIADIQLHKYEKEKEKR